MAFRFSFIGLYGAMTCEKIATTAMKPTMHPPTSSFMRPGYRRSIACTTRGTSLVVSRSVSAMATLMSA